MNHPGRISEYLYQLKDSRSGKLLVCFPYIGGYFSSFNEIMNHLDRDIRVLVINPPGHGQNMDAALDDIEKMADIYLSELKPHLDGRTVFFGYSLGGLVLYRLIVRMIVERIPLPKKLFIAASKPPHIIQKMEKPSLLNDGDFLKYVMNIGAIPPDFMENRQMISLMMPKIRADHRAMDFVKVGEELIDIPCTILYGTRDRLVPPTQIIEWDRYFEHAEFVPIEGEHMFIKSVPGRVGSLISASFLPA